MIFIKFAPDAFEFVTTLRGFIFLDGTKQDSVDTVTETVAETLFAAGEDDDETPSTKIRRFVVTFSDNIPGVVNTSLDEAVRYLRKSIVVRRLDLVGKQNINTGEGRSQPVWNVYITPPTKNPGALRSWHDFIRSLEFITDGHKSGTSPRTFCCKVCRAIDHPTGMCPYPSLRGWKAPAPPEAPLALDNTDDPLVLHNTRRTPRSRDTSNTRSNRGRTNGRGSRTR